MIARMMNQKISPTTTVGTSEKTKLPQKSVGMSPAYVGLSAARSAEAEGRDHGDDDEDHPEEREPGVARLLALGGAGNGSVAVVIRRSRRRTRLARRRILARGSSRFGTRLACHIVGVGSLRRVTRRGRLGRDVRVVDD